MNNNPWSLATALFLVSLLFSLSTCRPVPRLPPSLATAPDTLQKSLAISAADQDRSCSYFSFLSGIQAIDTGHYKRAETALRKALTCDPESRFILQSLPPVLIKMGKDEEAASLLRIAIAKYPEAVQARRLLARLAVRNNKQGEAIALYRKLITLTPKDESLFLRLGLLYADLKRYQEADKTYHLALALNPKSFFANLLLARLAAQNADPQGAEKWYQKAMVLKWLPELALEVGEFYMEQKDFHNGELQYRSILRKSPEDRRALIGLIQSLLLQNRRQQALDALIQLRRDSSNTSPIDLFRAKLFLQLKETEQAVTILEPMSLKQGQAEASLMLALIRYQQGKYHKALELLSGISPKTSQFSDSLSLKVQILIKEHKGHLAIETIREALSNPDVASPGLYTLLASLYLERDQIAQGYRLLDAALLKYPKSAQIHFEYGLLLDQDDAKQKAVDLMEKTLKLAPDHPGALNYLGYTWADNNIHLQKAMDYIQRAMTLRPDNGYIKDSLGWVYFRMGRLQEATKEILQALALEPKDPNIHEHLGDIYQKRGLTQKAIQAYRDATKFFKKDADQDRLKQKIHAIQ